MVCDGRERGESECAKERGVSELARARFLRVCERAYLNLITLCSNRIKRASGRGSGREVSRRSSTPST